MIAFAATTYSTAGLFNSVLGGMFVLATCIFFFVSILLSYHWTRYSMGDPFIPFMQIVYFLGALILLATALIFIL